MPSVPHPDWKAEWQAAKAQGISFHAWAQSVGTSDHYARLLVRGKRTGTRPRTHEQPARDVVITRGPQAGKTRHIPARKVQGSLAEMYTEDRAGLWLVHWKDQTGKEHTAYVRVAKGRNPKEQRELDLAAWRAAGVQAADRYPGRTVRSITGMRRMPAPSRGFRGKIYPIFQKDIDAQAAAE